MLKIIFLVFFFPILQAMTMPFETLLLETPSIANVKYSINKVQSRYSLPLQTSANVGQLFVDKTVKPLDPNNYEVTYVWTNKGNTNVQLEQLTIELPMNLEQQVMLAEGFQCWSTTKEMDKYNKLASIPSVVSWVTQFNLQGDYDFFNYSGQAGHIHSTGYTYFRHTVNNAIVFLGSVSESSGYTYFKADLNKNKFTLYKDIDGKVLQPGDALTMQLYVAQRADVSGLRSIWQTYAGYFDPSGAFSNPKHLTGWSSWYNTYERVTEQDVLSSLNGFKTHGYPIDVFQIDDGFEVQVGDWLDVDTRKFPRGMKALADDIKAQQYIPGIWLAPYAVGFKSKLVKEHPEWLLKHADGSLVVAGPNWGGFYALDIYNTEARRHLQHVFDQVMDVWGYKLLKLDFLFAAAMIPRLGKSRGEIMSDAMDLIVELTQKRAILLGSGVTLPSVWGRLEYSRVSSDASPWWDHSVLRLANVRERVATNNAITSTLHRWFMGSTVFGSDPDVFFIRSNNNKLSADEKHTLLVINVVFGQLTLMSDDVGLYDEREHQLYASLFPKPEATVQRVTPIGNNVFQVAYRCNGRDYLFFTNLSPIPFTTQLPLSDAGEYDYYFEQKNVLVYNRRIDWLKSQSPIFLKAHETRKFMKITSEDRFMGSTGNIVPGAEIEDFDDQSRNLIRIKLKTPHAHKKFNMYLRIDPDAGDLPEVDINDEYASRVERLVWNEDISLIKVVMYE